MRGWPDWGEPLPPEDLHEETDLVDYAVAEVKKTQVSEKMFADSDVIYISDCSDDELNHRDDQVTKDETEVFDSKVFSAANILVKMSCEFDGGNSKEKACVGLGDAIAGVDCAPNVEKNHTTKNSAPPDVLPFVEPISFMLHVGCAKNEPKQGAGQATISTSKDPSLVPVSLSTGNKSWDSRELSALLEMAEKLGDVKEKSFEESQRVPGRASKSDLEETLNELLKRVDKLEDDLYEESLLRGSQGSTSREGGTWTIEKFNDFGMITVKRPGKKGRPRKKRRYKSLGNLE